jgi:hypothetical protein
MQFRRPYRILAAFIVIQSIELGWTHLTPSIGCNPPGRTARLYLSAEIVEAKGRAWWRELNEEIPGAARHKTRWSIEKLQ